MPPIRAVFLDAGGVLLLPAHERVREALAAAGLVADDATIDAAHYRAMRAFDDAGPGLPERADAYRAAYLEHVSGGRAAADALVEAMRAVFDGPGVWTHPTPDARPTLDALASHGLPVVVVSNTTHGDVTEQLAQAAVCQAGPGQAAPVAAIVDSALVGLAKPDPGIFAIALEAAGSAPAETIHVGDSVAMDVGGAHAAGIAGWHVDPLGLCRDGGHGHLRRVADVLDLLAPG